MIDVCFCIMYVSVGLMYVSVGLSRKDRQTDLMQVAASQLNLMC